MWGPLTVGLAHGVKWLARGHRAGTHDFVVAPIAAGLVTWLASLHPWTQGVVLALAIGLALRSVAFAIPGLDDGGELAGVNLALSVAGAWLLLHAGAVPAWLPWAVVLGVVVHIVGDAVTEPGIPRPFSWLFGRAERLRGGPVKVAGRVEKFLIGPVLVVMSAGLVCLNVPDVTAAVRNSLHGAASVPPGSQRGQMVAASLPDQACASVASGEGRVP